MRCYIYRSKPRTRINQVFLFQSGIAIVIYFIEIYIIYFVRFLTTYQRSILVLIGMVPPTIYMFALYAYSSDSIVEKEKKKLEIWSAVSLLALLLPCVILVFRYLFLSIYVQSLMKITLAFALFVLANPIKLGIPKIDGILGLAFLNMKKVMWDFWATDYEDIGLSSREEVARKKHYFSTNELIAFQDTLLCSFLESLAAVELMPQWTDKKISVLDIGGGDGRFTKYFLRALNEKGNILTQLHMVDPGTWSEIYANNVSEFVDRKNIQVSREKIENFSVEELSDIVIASHSLYSLCDNEGCDPARIREAVIGFLIPLLKRDGFLLVVLASARGTSYSFKDKALRFLFNKEVTDANAEFWLQSAMDIRNKLSFKHIDSCFNINGLLTNYDNGITDPIVKWLSYFLRYEIERLSRLELSILVELLRSHAVRFGALGEEVIRRINLCADNDINEDDLVLAHKTTVFIYHAP